MGQIFDSIIDTIGRTPLVRAPNVSKSLGVQADVIFKLESFNPMSSVKDRIGYSMILDALDKGVIKEGTTVIEPTSGNTGIGLAFVCAAKGIPLVLTMPETMSIERRKILKALGSKVVLTEGPKGMKGAIAKAEELHAQTPNSIIIGQFVNPANPAIHRKTTAVEIWNDTDGKIDIFIAGVGTGGTTTGCTEVLKERNPKLWSVAVEPVHSPVLTQAKNHEPLQPGPHKIQGIGAGFVPEILKLDIVDEIFRITNDEAMEMGRRLCREDGMMVGISSGGVAHAAFEIAKRPENKGKRIVAVLASHGERYLTTALYDFPGEEEAASP
ncbi:MAG TPA: cysteine synthase A [Thermoanaerobaculia bacterium]|jgi:cysteine synthase A|nr:cysteine synthase A [Thermoanaerobaculia bacterium]